MLCGKCQQEINAPSQCEKCGRTVNKLFHLNYLRICATCLDAVMVILDNIVEEQKEANDKFTYDVKKIIQGTDEVKHTFDVIPYGRWDIFPSMFLCGYSWVRIPHWLSRELDVTHNTYYVRKSIHRIEEDCYYYQYENFRHYKPTNSTLEEWIENLPTAVSVNQKDPSVTTIYVPGILGKDGGGRRLKVGWTEGKSREELSYEDKVKTFISIVLEEVNTL